MVKVSIIGFLFSTLFLVAALGNWGLVFDQTFDEPGGEVVRDATPSANAVTIHGAAFIPRGEGYALHFDGVDDYAECPSSPSLDLTDAVTIEAWVRPDRATEPPCETGIVGKGVAYGLTYFRDRPHIYISSTINNCSVVVPLKEWSHVVGTFDGTQLSIYLDGRLADTYSADRNHMTEPGLHAVSIELGGVELLPEKSVRHDFPGCHSGSTLLPRMNFHRRVFRAITDTVELSISDWSSPTDPGGPVGQKLIFNFIQVEPYLED